MPTKLNVYHIMASMFKQTDIIFIDNPEISKMITRFKLMYYLEPFFVKEKTLTEASNELGIKLPSYHYWIKKFLSLGLLVITHEQRRAGSTIKYYMTPAKEILVTVRQDRHFLEGFYSYFTKKYNLDVLMSKETIRAIKHKNQDLGILLSCNKPNDLFAKPVLLKNNKIDSSIDVEIRKSEAPAVVTFWRDINLDKHDSKELQNKLMDLLFEYDKKAKPSGQRYLIQAHMAPVT